MKIRWTVWLAYLLFFAGGSFMFAGIDLNEEMRAPRIMQAQGEYTTPMRYKSRTYYVKADDHRKLVWLSAAGLTCGFLFAAVVLFERARERATSNSPGSGCD